MIDLSDWKYLFQLQTNGRLLRTVLCNYIEAFNEAMMDRKWVVSIEEFLQFFENNWFSKSEEDDYGEIETKSGYLYNNSLINNDSPVESGIVFNAFEDLDDCYNTLSYWFDDKFLKK